MSVKRTEYADGTWVEEYTGDDLHDMLDEEPAAQCSVCQRKTWAQGMAGQTCFMPQPNGDRCHGLLRPIPKGKP